MKQRGAGKGAGTGIERRRETGRERAERGRGKGRTRAHGGRRSYLVDGRRVRAVVQQDAEQAVVAILGGA